jgi:two-component system, chemotaxis family, sensor kinase CheA
MMIEDEELQAIYEFSCKERLQKLRHGLLHLENDPADAMTWGELRREIHSLKGDFKSVGLETITLLAQHIEVILSGVQHQEIDLNPIVCDRLAQGFDHLEALIQAAVTSKSNPVNIEQAIAQLAELTPSASASIPLASIPRPPEQSIALEITVDSSKAPLFIEDQELREIYYTTTIERLHSLEANLLQLARSSSGEATQSELLRQIHSLKGDAIAILFDL